MRTVAETAQRTLVPLGRVEVESTTIGSPRMPPVDAHLVRSDSKAALREAVTIAGPKPSSLALAYATEPDGRFTMVMVREDEGFALASDTRVLLTRDVDGDALYLLLGREDGRLFETLSTDYDGRRLAILDGYNVLATPTMIEPIRGGQIRIDDASGSAASLYETLTGRPAPEPGG